MILKGFVIGHLGIPLSFSSMPLLLETIDFYEEWISNGYISYENVVNIIVKSLKKLKSHHNTATKAEDYYKSIS